MLKKILCILLALVVLQGATMGQAGGDQRTTTTRIADLLAQMPANDGTLLAGNMGDIAKLGEDGYVTLIDGLAANGKGNNALLQYAIGGFSAYVSQPGQEHWRSMSVNAYCKALAALKDKQNKAFIISQLELVGRDDAVDCLAGFLTDKELADPAARALVKIGTATAKSTLLQALKGAKGPAQITIIEALGDACYQEAAQTISDLTVGNNAREVKVALYALAQMGDPSSEPVLYAAAAKNNFRYDPTNAMASYGNYAAQLVKNGHKELAEQVATKILAKSKTYDQTVVRTAALKVLIDADAAGNSRYLMEAVTDPNSSAAYREAALQFATPYLDEKTTGLWMEKLPEVTNAAKAAIIRMFERSNRNSNENMKATVPAILKLCESKNEQVFLTAIEAAGSIGGVETLDKLLPLMRRQDALDSSRNAAIADAVSRMNGQGITQKVAAAIPQMKATPKAQVLLLHILAAKAAHAELNTVYEQLSNENVGVKEAAYDALPYVVSREDLPQLFVLLNKAPTRSEDGVKVQTAIIVALQQDGDNDKAETETDMVLQQMSAAPAEKKLFFYKILASIGGDQSLKAVAQAYGTGDESVQNAALEALTAWKDGSAAGEVIKIARTTKNTDLLNKSIRGYLGLIDKTDYPAEEKLLMLRSAMEVAKTTAQKEQIIKDLEQAGCFNALVFAGKYLEDTDPALQQAAANAVMNITLAGNYNGTIVKDLLNKTIQTIKGSDAEYQKEGMRKYLSEMKAGEGFVPMFNGKDLTGWKGLVADPIKRAKMDAGTLASEQKKADAEMRDSWKVVDGELHFMEHGNNLATAKKYGDFEMLVDWKIIDNKKGQGDAGIYLRGTPQVQIWDNARTDVGAQVGSGGLYNNQANESKPLKVADNKLDEWNTFRILMKGDRVTVYLNGVLVTDNVILENYWDRKLPIFAEEQIELQAHGSPVAYRDLYIREIPRVKPYELSAQEKAAGFKVLFDGTNMYNWTGNTRDYIIEDGNIAIRPKPGKGSGGNLFTKEEFSDFNFRFEFKLTPGANNGLGIRAPYEGDAAYEGMELQILDNDAPMYKDLHVYQYHGSVYGTIPAKRGFLKPVGEWNYEEVIAKGPKIKVILNGTVILDGDITEARKNGAADGKPHPGLKRDSGHIGFLGHGSTVFFRNIRIKDLSKTKN